MRAGYGGSARAAIRLWARAGHVRVGWRCESSERQSDKVEGEELLARHGKVFSAARQQEEGRNRAERATAPSGEQRQSDSRACRYSRKP
jgi:hypothetical protein